MKRGPASVMGKRYEKRSDTWKIQSWLIINFYGLSMCQYLQQEALLQLKSPEEKKIIFRN